MDNVVTKLRVIFTDMFLKQFEDNPDIDNRTNLYIAEVTFIKNVVVSLTGAGIENNDELHSLACDIVDKIHKEFGDGCNIRK